MYILMKSLCESKICESKFSYLWIMGIGCCRKMVTIGGHWILSSYGHLAALAFLLTLTILSLQPLDKVYFSKLYIKSLRNSPIHRGAAMGMGMGSFKSYVRFVRWVPEASILPELDNLLHGFLQMY